MENKEPVLVDGIHYYGEAPTGETPPRDRSDDTWHDRKTPRKGCLHCESGQSGGHYTCTAEKPCQDCVDEGMTAAENVAAGFGPNGEDTGPDDY